MRIVTVIPTMPKNRDYAKLCVQSLLDTTDWMIILVVNGPVLKDITDYDLGIESDRVLIITTPIQGQCHAVNRGTKMLGSGVDYIFISNDDMYYAPGWNMWAFSQEWPLVWSPNLIEPENNHGSAPPFLKLDAGFTLDEFDQENVDKFVSSDHEDTEETTGFNFPVFIKKEVWDDIGGYDEEYDPWGSNSDTDLQTKIELAGIQPMRLRDVLVYHFSNKSGTFDGTHQAEWQHNFTYYRDKWGFTRDDDPKPDTWMATNLVNREKLIYHPDYEGKYA